MKQFFLVLIVSLLGITNAFAQDDLNFTVCAALRPCDGQGGVFPEFRGGECEAVYAEQCENIRTMSSATRTERKYSQCKVESKKQKITIRALKKQLRAAVRAKHALTK